MREILKRFLVLTLAAVLLTGTFAVSADAAMKRKVKFHTYTSVLKTADEYASKVKTGTTILTFPKSEGYFKFTAPEEKTYSFTFSNYKSSKSAIAFVSPCKVSTVTPSRLRLLRVPTKGGKSDELRLLSTRHKEIKLGKVIERYLHKRTAEIKLKKGETIYFYFYGSRPKNATMKLIVK